MGGRNHARPRGRSPPQREARQVEAEDRWDEGPRREKELSILLLFTKSVALLGLTTGTSDTPSTPVIVHRITMITLHGEIIHDPLCAGAAPPRCRDWDWKMELPMFDREDALGWLVRIERYYYSINGIEGDERMELVLVALEGRALNWF